MEWSQEAEDKHMEEYLWEPKLADKLNAGVFFDARIIDVADKDTALDCFLWRHQYECRRNAILAIAQSNFSARELHGVSAKNAIDMLLKKNIDIFSNTFPDNCLYGTYVKKILITKLTIDIKTNLEVECCRTDTKNYNIKDTISMDFLLSKYGYNI